MCLKMLHVECDHIPEQYPEILRHAIERGRPVAPRGYECLEIAPLCVSASFPRKRLFGTPGRNENPIFPYVEGLWILEGNDTPDIPSHYVRQTLCYINHRTGRFDGAYGPRIRSTAGMDQLDAVYSRLLEDRDTRRAVVTIFDPRTDNREDSLDVPCTVSWQFMVRERKLDMITYMRSNDLFRGFIYDTVTFQWFQEILAGWLGVDVGKYVHFVGSAHVYRSDKAKVEGMLSDYERSSEPYSLYRTHVPQDARLSKADFDIELRKLLDIEQRTREGMLLSEETAEQIENSFLCPFYRNLALAIAGFNAYKLGAIELSARLLDHIDNELGILMKKYHHSKSASKSAVAVAQHA